MRRCREMYPLVASSSFSIHLLVIKCRYPSQVSIFRLKKIRIGFLRYTITEKHPIQNMNLDLHKIMHVLLFPLPNCRRVLQWQDCGARYRDIVEPCVFGLVGHQTCQTWNLPSIYTRSWTSIEQCLPSHTSRHKPSIYIHSGLTLTSKEEKVRIDTVLEMWNNYCLARRTQFSSSKQISVLVERDRHERM